MLSIDRKTHLAKAGVIGLSKKAVETNKVNFFKNGCIFRFMAAIAIL